MLPADLIRRDLYMDRVIPYIGKNLIKVFTGQRRVGKSYLLFQIISHVQKTNPAAHIIYINKEDLQFDPIRSASDLSDYIHHHKAGKTYVFIDEIQDIPDFEVALRSLALDKDLDIYCTGSNARLLSGDVAGFLSGRHMEIAVFSLSYPEFLEFHQLDNSHENLMLYMKFGGLPYLRHLPLIEEIAWEYLKNIYSTIAYRDIIQRYAVRNVHFLERLVIYLAAHIGSLFSAKNISDYLKSQKTNMAPNQVQVYIQHLMDAFIILSAKRYDIKGKRLFEFGEKYYFENLGIRNAIWGFRPDDLGKIIENMVFCHLQLSGYQVHVGKLDQNEIDFIAQKYGEKKYIQVVLRVTDTKTLKREFGNLLAIKDNYPKLIITFDKFSGNTMDGIEIVNLKDFLSSY